MPPTTRPRPLPRGATALPWAFLAAPAGNRGQEGPNVGCGVCGPGAVAGAGLWAVRPSVQAGRALGRWCLVCPTQLPLLRTRRPVRRQSPGSAGS